VLASGCIATAGVLSLARATRRKRASLQSEKEKMTAGFKCFLLY